MAAIRMLFSWLTEKGVLAMNPAREVKTERFSRTEGKTPAFVEGEVQKLIGAIETSTHTGLRDRALLGVLAYTFARIGAVVNLKVEDYYPSGKRFLLRFKEKGGKEKELPVHHKLEELLDEYLKATGLGSEPGSLLFQAALGKTGRLSRRALATQGIHEALQDALGFHYDPGKLFQRTSTLQLLGIVHDNFDAKHALAFGINLQSQLAAAQLEHR
jgi:site-specific recombinase XerC